MEKLITIGNHSYHMRSSVYTAFKYKQETGKELIAEIQKLNPKNMKDPMAQMTTMIYGILDVAYVMIEEYNRCYNEKTPTKEEWLMGMDNLLDDTNWILDVLNLAMFPFQPRNNNFTG